MVRIWAITIIAGVAALMWAVLPAAAAPLRVVATTGMIADAAAEVGGPDVTVTGLMGAGVDPHSYRQTRADILAMAQADLVLWHGLYLEAQLEDFMADLSVRTPVRAVAETLPRDRLIASGDYADRMDPHVWMDPVLWQDVVAAVAAALSEADPAHAEAYAARAADYTARLDALQDYAVAALDSVPPEARVLVTAHDAFAYFGRAYGYEVLGVQGISTDSEAGLARIEGLVSTLVDRKIGAIFVESSVSDRNLRALVEGAAARGHDVRIGGELFSDAMGPPATYTGTYIGMIDHNVTTIARALGGTVPAGGFAAGAGL